MEGHVCKRVEIPESQDTNAFANTKQQVQGREYDLPIIRDSLRAKGLSGDRSVGIESDAVE